MLEKLQQALERIPANGAINLARRRALILQINRLLEEMETQEAGE